MAIELICGLPGHGKGCLAVDRIFRGLARGRTIYVNFPVYKPGTKVLHPKLNFFSTWSDMQGLANGDVYLDEAQRWFSSRDFKNNRPEDLEYFQEQRHNGLNLKLICQHPGQLDVDIRDRLCAYVWYVKRMWGPNEDDEPTWIEGKIGWLARCQKFSSMDFKSAKRLARARYTINLLDYHELYDSYWRIGSREGAGTGEGLYVRPQPLAGAVGQQSVTLLDGRTLTREEYLAGMTQETPGSAWVWREQHEVGDDIFGKGIQPHGQTTHVGPDLGSVRHNGRDRGASDGAKNDGGSARLGKSHRTVFKLVGG